MMLHGSHRQRSGVNTGLRRNNNAAATERKECAHDRFAAWRAMNRQDCRITDCRPVPLGVLEDSVHGALPGEQPLERDVDARSPGGLVVRAALRGEEVEVAA